MARSIEDIPREYRTPCRRAGPYSGGVFGLTFEKLLVIGVIAAFIIGPERLPDAAERLAGAVRWLRGQADTAKDRLREEMGDEFDEVDWRKLDPRQYDPRRIIRDALLEDTGPSGSASAPGGSGGATAVAGAAAATTGAGHGAGAPAAGGATSASRPAWAVALAGAREARAAGEPAPFDSEAT